MPITLPPISRRRFLAGSVAAGLGLALNRYAVAADTKADQHRFVLLADTHINADPMAVNLNQTMAHNFRAAVASIATLPYLPAGLMIAGDCAHKVGTAGDYATLLELLGPVRKLDLPVHFLLGNHDDRANFWAAIPAEDRPAKAVADRHTAVVRSPRADFYLLDTLDKVDKAPGTVGKAQLTWLAKALDEQPTKPAIVVMHHPPFVGPNKNGTLDGEALMNVLSPRRQVKAVFYGHTHRWLVEDPRPDGLLQINLPPVSYVFAKGVPLGFVELSLNDDNAVIQLTCQDAKHPQHQQQLTLKWRA